MHRLKLNLKLLYSLLTRDLRTIYVHMSCGKKCSWSGLVIPRKICVSEITAMQSVLSLVVEVQPKSVNFKIDFPLCTQIFFNLAPLNNYRI